MIDFMMDDGAHKSANKDLSTNIECNISPFFDIPASSLEHGHALELHLEEEEKNQDGMLMMYSP